MRPTLVAFALAVAAASLRAQYDQELSVPTNSAALLNATVADVTAVVQSGYRPIDFEVTSASPLRMNATFVQNSGAYYHSYWWYTGITASQVSSFLTTNHARLSELEPYDDGNGNTRFVCVMVDNTGANARQWGWLYNTSTTTISNVIAGNGHRIFDLDRYTIGGTTYYSCITIANTGADNRAWWWYLNVTASQIGTLATQNQARLSDLQRRSNGNYDVVMQRDASSPTWHWFPGLSSSAVYPTLNNYAQRPVCIDSYLDPSTLQRRYIVLGIQNENDLTAGVCELMHDRTNGTMGAYLKQVNGPVLAGFNEDQVFEPASALKVLAHAHAMRQVLLGGATLTESIPVATSMNGSCPTGSNVVHETLQFALGEMMQASDNARTAAVVSRFGLSAINGTAFGLGMSSTHWNHTIGCGTPTNANELTLHDLSRLHEQVANGFLGQWRDTFYDLMTHDLSQFDLDVVIAEEANAIGGFTPQSIAHFTSMCSMVNKKGKYELSTGGPFYFQRTDGGWMRIPFVVGGVVVQREYTFGAFVNNGADDLAAADAIYHVAVPELLRPTLHAALASWTGSLATANPFGAGCGASTPLVHTLSGLPSFGKYVNYLVSNAPPASIAMLAYGLSKTVANGVPLPVSLAAFGGGPGCQARVSLDSMAITVTDNTGLGIVDLLVPNNSSLLGYEHYTQFYVFGAAAFWTSNGLTTHVGL